MKAYVVLDGGGVKGAALAGCLQAAEEYGVEVLGYGGTSAGSIVALLASVGYTPQELNHIMVEDLEFTTFLDDQGAALTRLRDGLAQASGALGWGKFAALNWKLLRRLRDDFGLYSGDPLESFLHEKICRKYSALKAERSIRFSQLRELGAKPLKIVATDIGARKAEVYSAEENDVPVLDAVRASSSYPFVFKPVPVNRRYLVDGGLSSNLPIFLFDRERKRTGAAVLAFDLVATPTPRAEAYKIRDFLGDLMGSALESSEQLLQDASAGINYVRVPIPADVDTLDFGIGRTRRADLFRVGMVAAQSYFAGHLAHWGQVRNSVEELQALYAPPEQVIRVLRSYAHEVEELTGAVTVRAHIMLPTTRNTRLVVYQYGMDDDPDSDLELEMDAGCSGKAWVEQGPVFADLDAAKSEFPRWKMTKQQQNRVRADRKAMWSVPMFDPRSAEGNPEHQELLGVLSIDTETSLPDSGWLGARTDVMVHTSVQWASVCSRLLT